MNGLFQAHGLSESSFDKNSGIYLDSSHVYDDRIDRKERFLLDILKKSNDLSLNSEELLKYMKDWETRLGLSYRRANILISIEDLLDKNSNVLEIGAGCGAITRYLGENYREVDAIEPSFIKARIAGYRTHDLKNVRVYCGDPFHISFEKKYDIIVLIGSLDWLPYHTESGMDPKLLLTMFLKRLTESLSENGLLALAAQNKLSIKNFSGYRGMYSGSYFEAVMDNTRKLPIAFSRKEIEQMVIDSQLRNYQFYHIFPDYHFAETVIVENEENLSLKPYNWIRTPFEDQAGDRIYGFPESLLLKTFTENALLWQFSNSFLVLASKSPAMHTGSNFLIKKFHNHEYENNFFYHIVSLVKTNDNEYIVHRFPIASGKRSVVSDTFECKLDNNSYVHGNLLSMYFILNSIKEDSIMEIHRTLKYLHDDLLLKHYTGETDEFDYPLLKGVTIDYVSDNLIVDDRNKIHCIDTKGNLKRNCPVDYILFRNLFYLYARMGPYISEKDVVSFISNQIKMIYPQFSKTRFYYNLRLERQLFKDMGNNTIISIKSMVQQKNCYNISRKKRFNIWKNFIKKIW